MFRKDRFSVSVPGFLLGSVFGEELVSEVEEPGRFRFHFQMVFPEFEGFRFPFVVWLDSLQP